jgi:hypothetical protein
MPEIVNKVVNSGEVEEHGTLLQHCNTTTFILQGQEKKIKLKYKCPKRLCYVEALESYGSVASKPSQEQKIVHLNPTMVKGFNGKYSDTVVYVLFVSILGTKGSIG